MRIAEQYARDVTSGEIPASKWVRLACQRHLDDLAWQDADGFRFRLDEKQAVRACSFIELMPHTKGKWAAQGQNLIMSPWQVFLTVCLFGWLRKRDNTRRFRRALLVVPRKNGKSAWAAAVGLFMLCADGEHGAEIYSGATSEKQAWEVFKPAQIMANKSPALLSHYGVGVNASNINILATASKFETVIGKPGDGASPSCAIVDEYHEHQTDALYSTMETGMGAREHPLMLVITTAGDNIAGPCYAMQEEAQAMLEGSRQDDDLLALIYGIDAEDDWTDPEALKKANPNFGVSVSKDFLLTRQREAMMTPRKAGEFKTKHLNVWVQAKDSYFNVLRFQEAADEGLRLDDFAGRECIIGIDLAEKRDLTAVELLFHDGEQYTRFGRYYCPEETIEQPENEHFRTWRDTGQLIQTDGAVVDMRVIQEDLEQMLATFDVREVAFDPWRSRQMGVELMEKGANCVEFGNAPRNMNEPMRALDALIADRKLRHDGGAAFTWMLSNVVDASRSSDLHRPGKTRPGNKIDGPVALIMALGRWLMDEAVASPTPWDADPTFSLADL